MKFMRLQLLQFQSSADRPQAHDAEMVQLRRAQVEIFSVHAVIVRLSLMVQSPDSGTHSEFRL
jgi:hypothetical protein